MNEENCGEKGMLKRVQKMNRKRQHKRHSGWYAYGRRINQIKAPLIENIQTKEASLINQKKKWPKEAFFTTFGHGLKMNFILVY